MDTTNIEIDNKVEIKTTTLPYKLEDLEYFRTNTHIIDLANSTLSPKVCLVQLYNTQFPFFLSFEGLSKEKLEEFVRLYLTLPFDFNCFNLVSLIMDVVSTKNEYFVRAIDPEYLEKLQYIKLKNTELFDELQALFDSAAYCAVKRFKLEGLEIEQDIEDYPYAQNIKCNIHWFFEHPSYEYFYSTIAENKVYNFEMFKETNNVLFDSIQKLNFMPVLQGFAEHSPEEFNKALSLTDVES